MPSYVTVNNGAEIKTINIKNECLKCIKNNCQCGQVGGRVYNYIIQSSNPFTASSVGAQIKYDQIGISLQEG